jgi:hypothetical protein
MNQKNQERLPKNKNKLYVFGAMHKVKPIKFLHPVRILSPEGKELEVIQEREIDDWDKIFQSNHSMNPAVDQQWKREQSMMADYDRQTESYYAGD